jgi:antitoxin (DNA-binding transcriptional repressor) of toxin-antitoxin stability system
VNHASGPLVTSIGFPAVMVGLHRLAKLAYLAHRVCMNADVTELSVSQARDHFSDAVNRAAFGGEITYVTRGRNQKRAAAIVPAGLVEQYEAMIDLEDGRIAQKRLADLDAGRTTAVPADEAARALGL